MVEKFSTGTEQETVLPESERPTSERAVSVATDGDRVALELDGHVHQLAREDAAALRDALGSALSGTREFVRTAGEHREDGSYVVSRRGAESAGHSKVFDSFGAVEALVEHLPATFTAEDVGRNGLTGGRRHMLLWHVAEHPGFDCELVSRQPLTVRKSGGVAEN